MISALLPISNTENPKLIDRCLKSLARQTYKDFEVLIVTSKNTAQKISRITKKYPFVKILKKDLGKSAARNFASKKAKGNYLLHLDADVKLSQNLLEECLKVIEKEKGQVIAFGYKELPGKNFWNKCRALERKIFFRDSVLEGPEFIKKSLFEQIGGFDPQADPLDDWDLHLALKSKGIKFSHIKPTVTRQSEPTLRQTVSRMFKRGQAISKLKKKYKKISQLNTKRKFKIYLKNWKTLLSSPLIVLGLAFLKVIDALSFYGGMFYPKKIASQKNAYLSYKVAGEYEAKRLGTNYRRYKHFAECQSLFSLLQKKSPILEIGCGTGRITAELVKNGFSVIPTDPSEAMLEQFRKKTELPKPIKASGKSLPFKDNHFKTVFALRVIWHLPPKEKVKVISEMNRVSSQFVILDITNKKRFLAKLLIDSNAHPSVLEEFSARCQKRGLRVKTIIPLEVALPVWLNLIPRRLSTKCFPLLYRLDLALAKVIPPGRYLLKLKKDG